MSNKSYCSQVPRPQATRRPSFVLAVSIAAAILVCVPRAMAGGDAPQWMHSLVNLPLPAYDDKTDAVLLYSETNVIVVSTDKIRIQVREAYKILRPNGRQHGTVSVRFDSQRKLKSFHGWCIPAQGKDYEVKDKDAIERALLPSGELASDAKLKILNIPAPDPGNIIGYEYEVEDQPLFLQEIWGFQETDPVRESHFSLQLPPGWEYKSSWLSYKELKPAESAGNLSQWVVSEVKGIRYEPEMPALSGIAGRVMVS